MKFLTKILILSLSLFSFEAYSKAINFYCKSKFGGDAGVAWDVYIDMQQSNASIRSRAQEMIDNINLHYDKSN